MVVVVLMLIPAVIAVYRYSQALFVFIDNPELKVKECIEKSKELTLDNKKKLFFLDLSFIGWGLAAAAPVKECQYRLLISIPMLYPSEEGLSSREEFPVLCEI